MKMKLALTLIFGMVVSLSLQGCKWRDDFRSRVHPQYQEEEPEPTFNRDSDYYVGDEVVTGKRKDGPKLEAIDELSEIPELPDKPQVSN